MKHKTIIGKFLIFGIKRHFEHLIRLVYGSNLAFIGKRSKSCRPITMTNDKKTENSSQLRLVFKTQDLKVCTLENNCNLGYKFHVTSMIP